MRTVLFKVSCSSSQRADGARGMLASGPSAVMVGETLKSMKDPGAVLDDMSMVYLASSCRLETARNRLFPVRGSEPSKRAF